MAFNFASKGWFKTIEDMETAYYGYAPSSLVVKDAPVLTTTTGVRNAIYGAQIQAQLNMASNTAGALAKKPWDKSGVRLVTAKTFTDASPALGQTKGGATPATVKPTFAVINIEPKTMARTFEMSSAELAMEGKDDVLQWTDLVDYMRQDVLNDFDQQLLAYADTVPTVNMESIDRLVGSHDEVAEATNSLDANDIDIWGLDRDAADSYAAGYVNFNGGVAQSLALSQADDVLAHIMPFWDNTKGFANKMWLTKYDTNMRLGQLINTQFRHVDKMPVQFGVNGIQTFPGVDHSNMMASYQGIPIVPDDYVDNHYAATTGIGKLYCLDLDHVWIQEAMPFQYAESDEMLATGVLGRRGIYHAVTELSANMFKCHGKVMALI